MFSNCEVHFIEDKFIFKGNEMLDRKSIARKNIEKWMERDNLTQAELSRRMGISYQYMWRLLKSDRSIGPKIEQRLVQAFGLKSIGQLYKDPAESNPMLDRLIDKEAKLIDNEDDSKLQIVEKLVDLLQNADADVVSHIDRQIQILKRVQTKEVIP